MITVYLARDENCCIGGHPGFREAIPVHSCGTALALGMCVHPLTKLSPEWLGDSILPIATIRSVADPH